MDIEEIEVEEMTTMGVLELSLEDMQLNCQDDDMQEEEQEEQIEREIIEYTEIPLDKLCDAVSGMIRALRYDVSPIQAQCILADTLSKVAHYTTETVPGHVLFNAFLDALADANCGGYW
jgi:phenylalanine-4-hydroxylase